MPGDIICLSPSDLKEMPPIGFRMQFSLSRSNRWCRIILWCPLSFAMSRCGEFTSIWVTSSQVCLEWLASLGGYKIILVNWDFSWSLETNYNSYIIGITGIHYRRKYIIYSTYFASKHNLKKSIASEKSWHARKYYFQVITQTTHPFIFYVNLSTWDDLKLLIRNHLIDNTSPYTKISPYIFMLVYTVIATNMYQF